MAKTAGYCEILRQKPEPDWEAFLEAESGLPGPRGNLELAYAAADCGRLEQFEAWLAGHPAEISPTNTPGEFVAVCGAMGLGRLAGEGDPRQLERLRGLANDPRWRVREGVAMALQILGKLNMQQMLACAQAWAGGSLLEARAAAAGVCEPALLKNPDDSLAVLSILDKATRLLANFPDRQREDFKTLRQGLAYCWSVAIAAYPAPGKAAFEAWIASASPDVRWLLRENLKKNRLIRLDPAWADACRERLGVE